ncbi:MAG: PaaI family thioesterase [Rhodoferax sp.]|uniref:PaaI family thioesterase n=1 Tax=Rhodoferax sp. TaxID=50421 RepID=UPI003BB1CBA2|nr:PaaI family thioesterase [Rhodoferax sp.]
MTPTDLPLQRVQTSFERQGLMRHWGAQVERVEPGLCVLSLPYSDKVTQQQAGFHGGAMGALADIAAGYAGLTQAPAGMEVVTVEYKINFLASCQGGKLLATGRVVKAGKRVIVASAEVLHVADDGRETACAVLQQTLMAVPKTY